MLSAIKAKVLLGEQAANELMKAQLSSSPTLHLFGRIKLELQLENLMKSARFDEALNLLENHSQDLRSANETERVFRKIHFERINYFAESKFPKHLSFAEVTNLYKSAVSSCIELKSGQLMLDRIKRRYRLLQINYIQLYRGLLVSQRTLTQPLINRVRNELLLIFANLEFPRMRHFSSICREAILMTFDRECSLIALNKMGDNRKMMVDVMLESLNNVRLLANKWGTLSDLAKSLNNLDENVLISLIDTGAYTSLFWHL